MTARGSSPGTHREPVVESFIVEEPIADPRYRGRTKKTLVMKLACGEERQRKADNNLTPKQGWCRCHVS